MKIKVLVISVFFVILILLAFYVFTGIGSDKKIIIQDIEENGEQFKWSQVGNWGDTELENVQTGEKFSINEFRGKPIILESFAVWCPTCTKQQKVIKDFHKEVGDTVISISLDTDADEDKDFIKNHAIKNGFDWNYAVSPIELTQDLISDFGPGIVSAPSVPVLIICEDGRVRKLDGGVKSVDDLKESVASCAI